AAEMLDEILRRLTHPVPALSYAAHSETIHRCFAGQSAEAIVSALEADPSDWAKGEAFTIRAKSPETVKVALRQLREGARCETFEDNMRMEFRIGWRKVQSHDFQEGVRAVIIDKDNAPVWSPARLEDVSQADVDRYFEPLGENELSFED
ncbi:MAG: enoyl-CoA hydratase, partial [Hyphomonas sp. 32-62-5]